eukprot:Opistho-2@25359
MVSFAPSVASIARALNPCPHPQNRAGMWMRSLMATRTSGDACRPSRRRRQSSFHQVMKAHPLSPRMPRNGTLRTEKKTTRRGRTRFTDTQLEALESSFGKNDHPNFTQLAQIAACVGVSERSAKVWFQNRRAKERKSARPAVASSYRSMTPSNLSHAVQRHVAAKPRIEPAPAVPHSQPQTHAQLVTHSPFAPPRAAFQPMPPGGMGRMMPLPVPYASGKAVGAQIGGSHPVATVPRQLMSAQQCVQPSAPAQQGPSSLKASNNNSTAIHSSSNNTAMPVLIASAAHSLPSSRSPSQMQSHAQSGELCGLNLLGMAALMVAGQTV